MQPGWPTHRARMRGVALGTITAALLSGCSTPDRVPATPRAAALPSPNNIAMEPRPAPQGQPREYLVGQSLPTAAQQDALEQPNQPAMLAKPTILNNPSSFNTISQPARPVTQTPPVRPITTTGSGMVMPASVVAAPAPQASPRLPLIAAESSVPPPDVTLTPPMLPPER